MEWDMIKGTAKIDFFVFLYNSEAFNVWNKTNVCILSLVYQSSFISGFHGSQPEVIFRPVFGDCSKWYGANEEWFLVGALMSEFDFQTAASSFFASLVTFPNSRMPFHFPGYFSKVGIQLRLLDQWGVEVEAGLI